MLYQVDIIIVWNGCILYSGKLWCVIYGGYLDLCSIAGLATPGTFQEHAKNNCLLCHPSGHNYTGRSTKKTPILHGKPAVVYLQHGYFFIIVDLFDKSTVQ